MRAIQPYTTTPALFAAWRKLCLKADGSFLFEGKTLWTTGNLNTVVKGVLGNPQIADGNFVARLREQFGDEQNEIRLLLCELLALHYCPKNSKNLPKYEYNWRCFDVCAVKPEQEDVREIIEKTKGISYHFENSYDRFGWFGVAYYASLALKYKEGGEFRQLIDDLVKGEPRWEDAEKMLSNENVIGGAHQSVSTPHAVIARHGFCPGKYTSIVKEEDRQKFLGHFSNKYPDVYNHDKTESENIFLLNNAFWDANPKWRKRRAYGGSKLIPFYDDGLLKEHPWTEWKGNIGGARNTQITQEQEDKKMEDKIEEYAKLLKQFYQIVFQGPPGTGKTHAAKEVVERLTGESAPGNHWKIIQFHPSYNYEDFVRGIQVATTDDGQVVYRTVNRVLATMAGAAIGDPKNNYVLIIDEINRANIAAVLGELIYALEYRGEPVETPYQCRDDYTVVLPKNLYIIGTMNTADRTIGQIDYAVRRRFAFISLLPEKEIVANHSKADDAVALFDSVAQLFAPGEEYLSPDYDADDVAIGHSYFLAEDNADLKMKMKYQVLPILNEYIKDGVLKAEAKEKIKEIFPNEWTD